MLLVGIGTLVIPKSDSIAARSSSSTFSSQYFKPMFDDLIISALKQSELLRKLSSNPSSQFLFSVNTAFECFPNMYHLRLM